jgi:cytochrome c553
MNMRGFVAGVAALIAAATVAPAAANASDDAAAAAAAFEAMSFQEKLAVCAACHGADGVSQIPGTPSLAGQPVNFTEYQLIFFRYDQRKDETMTPYGRPLTDDDLKKFGDYFAALPPPPAAQDNDPALTKAGKDLDNGHCEVCHLRTGKGDTPRLDGQREDYFVKAMQDYRSGARNGRGLGVMPEVADGMSDAEMRELAHYFAVQAGH